MPARDDDKAMDGLLRRSLARDSSKPGECLGADILASYYERSLDADEAAGYEQHIAQCSLCREHLAAFIRAESAAEVPAEQVLVPARPAALQPKAASRAPDSAAEKPKHSWVFGWRWLAPAAAVIVFAVFVYLRINPRETKSILSKNQVAAVKQEPAPPAPTVQDLDASGPATRSQAPPAALAKPPASSKSNAPPLEKKLAAPSSAPERATATHPPPAPRAAPPSGTSAGANATHGAPGISSRFTGGAMARGGTSAGAAASRVVPSQQTSAAPASPPAAKTADAGQRAVSGASGGAASGTAAPAPAPARVDAKKEAAAADSTAESAEATAADQKANDKANNRALAGRLIGENVGSVSETVTVAAAPSTVEVSQAATLFRITPEGALERSKDGGATWQLERLKTHAPIVALSAPTGNICWVVGRGGTILLTKNGKNWKKISPPEKIDLVGVTAPDAESATVTAIDGRKFSTADAGKTWELLN
jgi:hypothetical protein